MVGDNSAVMAQAFQTAAGFSGDNFSLLVRCMIGIFAIFWAMLMILGWMGNLRMQSHPGEYLLTRLTLLAMTLVLVVILIGG